MGTFGGVSANTQGHEEATLNANDHPVSLKSL